MIFKELSPPQKWPWYISMCLFFVPRKCYTEMKTDWVMICIEYKQLWGVSYILKHREENYELK